MKNKKLEKIVLTKLEQYYTNINEPNKSADKYEDLPNIIDDKEYKTFIPLEFDFDPEIRTKKGKNVLRDPVDPEDIKINDVEFFDKQGNEIDDLIDEILFLEQDEVEEEDENGMGSLAKGNSNPDENIPAEQNPNVNQNIEPLPNQNPADITGGMSDPNMGMGGIGLPGMETEPPKTAELIGRIFELKKIYSRLLSIESQLSFSPDIILLKLRRFITQSIELFETVISNMTQFRDQIDEIIIMYYEFLESVYLIMKKYYKMKNQKDKKI